MMDIGEVVKNNTSVGGEGVHKAHPDNNSTPPTDFVLQWGSRKRPRCMKIQVKSDSTTERTRVLVSRTVVRTTRDSSTTATTTNNNFRRPFSPPPPPLPSHRNPRNSETSSAMRGQANGAVASSLSPERVAEEKKGGNHNHNHSMNNGNGNVNGNGNGVGGGGGGASAASSDSKKGATSSGSDPAPVWLPKFVLTLTNKEKEEDFMAIKGSKLPQRPKKRAKVIQRSLNLVSPGSWLCDLTLERYEVREKKISKKRPRGLKAMGNMDSDSE